MKPTNICSSNHVSMRKQIINGSQNGYQSMNNGKSRNSKGQITNSIKGFQIDPNEVPDLPVNFNPLQPISNSINCSQNA